MYCVDTSSAITALIYAADAVQSAMSALAMHSYVSTVQNQGDGYGYRLLTTAANIDA